VVFRQLHESNWLVDLQTVCQTKKKLPTQRQLSSKTRGNPINFNHWSILLHLIRYG
jgi:hypothetical protein